LHDQPISTRRVSEEGPEFGTYRSVSPLAVAALLLGVGSALAHVHPLLWSVPLAAVCVAAIAIRSIACNDGLTGTGIATVGIVCACLFGSWAVVRAAVTNQVIRHESVAYAKLLMELVQKKDSLRLHQQTLHANHRGSEGDGLAASYRDSEDLRKSLDSFTTKEPMQTGLQIGPSFQWDIAPDIRQNRNGATHEIELHIHVSGTMQDQPWERETLLLLQRSFDKPLYPWRIMDWRLREPEKTPAN